jgi:type IV pilus assembly protein PilQ
MKRYSVLPVIIALAGAVQAQKVAEIFEQLSAPKPVAPAVTAEPGLTVSPTAVAIEPVAETVVIQTVSQPVLVEVVAPAPVVAVEDVSAAVERKEEMDEVIQTIAAQPEAEVSAAITGGLITLSLKEVELNSVIRLFATLSGANIIIPDLGTEAGVAKVDINLKDVAWRPALQAILDSHDLELFERNTGTEVYSVRKKLPPAEALRNTRTFLFKHADIKQASEMIKGIVGDQGQVFSYPQGNAIVVKTTQEIMDDVAQIAERIDSPRQQALIEARIMELSDGGSKERGSELRWDKILSGSARAANDGNPLKGAMDFGSVGIPNEIRNAPLTGLTGMGGLTLDSDTLSLFIAGLQTKGNARTVSNPRVIVANGETARINILERIPKLQRKLTETESAGGGTTRLIEVTQEEDGEDPDTLRKRFVEFEFGIRLAVTPTIYSEDNIAVQIVPIISRVNTDKTISTFIGLDNDGQPIIDTYYAIDEKRVNTTFMLGNQRTAVIGGLTESKDVERERKVPLLGSIPLIRHLFMHKYSEQVQTENIIFVTVSLEDGHNFNMDQAVKQSPLTRKQMIRDENNQVVEDRAVELFRVNSESRIEDELRVIERMEQGGVNDRKLLTPVRKVLRP